MTEALAAIALIVNAVAAGFAAYELRRLIAAISPKPDEQRPAEPLPVTNEREKDDFVPYSEYSLAFSNEQQLVEAIQNILGRLFSAHEPRTDQERHQEESFRNHL